MKLESADLMFRARQDVHAPTEGVEFLLTLTCKWFRSFDSSVASKVTPLCTVTVDYHIYTQYWGQYITSNASYIMYLFILSNE